MKTYTVESSGRYAVKVDAEGDSALRMVVGMLMERNDVSLIRATASGFHKTAAYEDGWTGNLVEFVQK